MPIIDQLCDDLRAEHDSLVAVVSAIDEKGWSTPTPAAGWDVRDTISHLTFFHAQATLAIDDPPAFEARKALLMASTPPPAAASDAGAGRDRDAGAGPDGATGRDRDAGAGRDAAAGPDVARGRDLRRTHGDDAALLERWTASRDELIARALRAVDDAGGAPPRVAWYGPPMSMASFISARIM